MRVLWILPLTTEQMHMMIIDLCINNSAKSVLHMAVIAIVLWDNIIQFINLSSCLYL